MAGQEKKKKKKKRKRSTAPKPAWNVHGPESEQVRYQLMIPPPEGEPAQEMVPWWERRAVREKMVKERKEARAKAKAEREAEEAMELAEAADGEEAEEEQE